MPRPAAAAGKAQTLCEGDETGKLADRDGDPVL
jgi:hypothetical protein